MKEYTDTLDSLRDDFQKKCEALGDKIRTEVVIPACKKHKLKFLQGMGTYFFSRGSKTYGADHDDMSPALRETLVPIFNLLDTQVFNNDVLGYYVGDVK